MIPRKVFTCREIFEPVCHCAMAAVTGTARTAEITNKSRVLIVPFMDISPIENFRTIFQSHLNIQIPGKKYKSRTNSAERSLSLWERAAQRSGRRPRRIKALGEGRAKREPDRAKPQEKPRQILNLTGGFAEPSPKGRGLWRGGETENVGVAECGRAIRVWFGLRRHSGPILYGGLRCGAPYIDRWAIGRIARVVPHSCPVRGRCHCVDIVSEKLQPQVVLAGTARVAGRTPMEFTPSKWRATTANNCMLHHTHQTARAGRVVAEWRRKRVIDEVSIRRRDGDCGIETAIACGFSLRGG